MLMNQQAVKFLQVEKTCVPANYENIKQRILLNIVYVLPLVWCPLNKYIKSVKI